VLTALQPCNANNPAYTSLGCASCALSNGLLVHSVAAATRLPLHALFLHASDLKLLTAVSPV
jgi:hypothetical protein